MFFLLKHTHYTSKGKQAEGLYFKIRKGFQPKGLWKQKKGNREKSHGKPYLKK